jgi:tetratricopeptide (TPR) repeat protein
MSKGPYLRHNESSRKFYNSFYLYICILLVCIFYDNSVLAHGTLQEQIIAATKRIEKDPNNAHYYYNRGESYRKHEEWDLALADLHRAKQLDPTITKVDFSHAKVMYGCKLYHSAKVILDNYIAQKPNLSTPRIIRAKVYVALNKPLLAIKDYNFAFNAIDHRDPDDYLDCARIFVGMGKTHVEKGIAILDKGMKKLGPLISLRLYCIDLEISIKHYSKALVRLKSILAGANRKERWLAQRGDILFQAGQLEKAKSSYLESIKHIEKLPVSRRNTPAMSKLKKSLLSKLKKFAN